MIDGVIFDLDGTILDSMAIWNNAAEIFLNDMGIQAEDNLGKTMFAMSITGGAKYLKNRYLLDMDISAIVTAINRTVEDFYCSQVTLKTGVNKFLKDLKQVNIKMVAATSSDRKIIKRALQRLDIIHYFERLFTCSEIGVGKNKPDIYLAAAEYMRAAPENIWVFEDALYAIQTAKQAGFKTVGVFDSFSIESQKEIQRISNIYLEKLDNSRYFLKKAFFKN